jgi:hypothetical protein
LKRVDAFFKTMEEQASKAHASVVASLADEGRRRAVTSMQSAVASNADGTLNSVLMDSNTGEILGTAVHTHRTQATIPLIWQIQEVSRDALDLEAIRPFLTEAALLTAARAHLKVHGPHSLTGVKYIQSAAVD